MPIREVPTNRRHANEVTVDCDYCPESVTLTAAFETKAPAVGPKVVLSGLHRKLAGRKWFFVQGTYICPACSRRMRRELSDGERKDRELAMAETTTETRQPTMEQKRSIMALLLECYDTERQLYRGSETDITLAETVGGGCMWGWVAKIREDNFGAGCGNEAAGDMSADVAAYRSSVMQAQRDAEAAVARIEALAAEARKVMQEAAIPFADLRAKGDALLAKMNALTKAFGPKVERAVK